MARGFDTTLGSSTTDRIELTLSTRPTLRSYHILSYRTGEGGGGFGRMWDTTGGGGSVDAGLNNGSVQNTYQFIREWSLGNGAWEITRPATNAWVAFGVSYDGGNVANNAVMYLDGISQTVTRTSVPSGSFGTTTGTYSLGNRKSDGTRFWTGMLAEFAVWDVILDAAEFAALGKGYSPRLIRPTSLVEYVPMLRDNISLKLAAPTITGTAVQPHPRVIYPKRKKF